MKAVDKNLFLYDLAVVAILKNEGHYLREWLDYHLLAGVDHFFLYDNDSTDDYEAIIAPYVAAGLVTSTRLSGGFAQYVAYNYAVRDYRFLCRYIAFIDLDEFLYPKSARSVVEVVEEILSRYPNASGLAVNWQLFGSNGQDKADYSRGVLERFTRRAQTDWVVPIPHRDIPGGNAQIKTIANPRRIYFFGSSHFPVYFEGCYSVNEDGKFVESYCNNPVTADRLVINHYNVKSREEHMRKIARGRADKSANCINDSWFDMYDRNEIFDDGILYYQARRADSFELVDDMQRRVRMEDALIKILSAYADDKLDDLETALTCRAASAYLRGAIYEEASLAAILKSLNGLTLSETRLLLSELPNLLGLPYPATAELRAASIQIISQLMDFMREKEQWREFVALDNLRGLLKNF